MAANPDVFACARCAHTAWEDSLWAVNARALDVYRRLCGRTVGDLSLAGWLVQQVTAGWSPTDRLDLIDRIERIRAVLDPPRGPTASG